jgi:PAS domain S-box-containing protein
MDPTAGDRSGRLDSAEAATSSAFGNNSAGTVADAFAAGVLAMSPSSKLPLSRRYALVMVLCALPLVLLVAGLAFYQFDAQRQAQLDALGSDNSRAKLVVDGVVKEALDHVTQLKEQAGDLLDGTVPSSENELRELLKPSFPPSSQTRPDGLTLDSIAATPLEHRLGNLYLDEERLAGAIAGEADMALALFEPMRLKHLVTPYLRWSYYFSASGAFVAISPFVRRQEMVEGFGHASIREMVDSYLTYDVYLDATPARNPGRSPYWSPPYLDAAGAGWMVSHATPVFKGDRLAGMLGTDLLLSFLDETLTKLPLTAGQIWIVSSKGELIADRTGTPVSGDAPRKLSAVLPSEIGNIDAALPTILTAGRHDLAGHRIFSANVAGTPWTLLHVVSDRELNGIIAGRIVPYAVILLGLLLSIFAAHWILRRQFVRPAIALVEHLRAESAGDTSHVADTPALWRPWADLVSRIFSQNRATMQKLAASEERYRSVVELQTEFVLRMTPDGYLSFVNDAYCRYHGKSREELLHPSWCDLSVLQPEERRRFDEHLARLTPEAPDASIELHNLMPDGRQGWSAWNDHGIFDGQRRLVEVQSVGRDITDRVLAEQARRETEKLLAESEAQFRAIAEGVPLPIIISAIEEAEILFVNEQARQVLGLEAGQSGAVAMSVWQDRSRREDLVRLLAADGVVDAFEAGLIGADGTRLDTLISARRITQGGRSAMLAAVTDITRQRDAEAEIARQRETLYQSEKLSALGSLLAGVAHELNNPLSVVIGYSSMLKEFSADTATIERADKIHAAAERCSRIVRTFLAMARKKPPARGAVDVNEIVLASLELAAYGLRSGGIETSTELAEPVPMVWGDADQLHQVVTNLIVNAQQALLQVPHPRGLTIVTAEARDGVEIIVADNGPGMPENVRSRAFEPFYTTKPAGEGTGVGLSVCQGIVTAHDGSITLDAEEGGGASFTVWLPRAPAESVAVPSAAVMTGKSAGAARVLVVDDDADIASMIAEMLRGDGHTVSIAEDATAALVAVKHGSIDLLVSDIRMPGLDGPGLYRALERMRPGLTGRLLFVTGDTLAPEIDRFISDTGAPVIEKPLDPQAFRRLVLERLSTMREAGA